MAKRKTVLRLESDAELHEKGKRRRIFVEFYPAQGEVLMVRAHGLRTRHAVSIEDIYRLGARKTAEAERRQKATERRSRGKR